MIYVAGETKVIEVLYQAEEAFKGGQHRCDGDHLCRPQYHPRLVHRVRALRQGYLSGADLCNGLSLPVRRAVLSYLGAAWVRMWST